MPPVTAPLADTSQGCDSTHTAIDSLCTLVRDHSGGAGGLTVAVLSRIVWPVAVLVLVIVAARLLRVLADRAVARSGADRQIATLVHNVVLAVGVAVAVGAALYAEGLDLGIFLTIGGLGTLAVSLAFQDLLRNVLAGILLLVERPFRIGDVITIDTLTGSVATIELRTTALRLGDGRLAIIPNLDAFSKTVVNLSAFDRRQFTVSAWVPAGADLEAAIRAARGVLEHTPEAVAEPPPRVQPAVDIDGGVTLQCQYWLAYRDCDPDAVAASVVRRLQAALSGAPAPRDLSTAVAPRAASASGTAVEEQEAPPAPRRRRRLRPGPE